MLTSPLHATHRALGARFIHWGGWEMPLNYGSVMAEHHAVRQDCGVFDVSCLSHVSVSGPDARPLLRRLLANDVDRLPGPGNPSSTVPPQKTRFLPHQQRSHAGFRAIFGKWL